MPKEAKDREALNFRVLNIKPRFNKKFRRLTNILKYLAAGFIACLFFNGYYPVASFPPLKQSIVRAADFQKIEIVPASLPFEINLPHPGYLSTKFSYFHPGVDIATGFGMPIHPIAEGQIQEVNLFFWGYGNHVVITHPGGYKSLYGHMGKVYVKADQPVTSSTIIGTVGMTGHTSGPHTHLEITKDGKFLDPVTVLPKISDLPAEKDLKLTDNLPL